MSSDIALIALIRSRTDILCTAYGYSKLNYLFNYLRRGNNGPFSYSENESGSNDISSNFVEFSNVDNCGRSSNATQSNLA